MSYKVQEKKFYKTEDEKFMKNYMKAIALEFDETHGTIKQCKAAYKKHHKEIGIVANLDGEWIEDDSSRFTTLQLCELFEQPHPNELAKFEIIEGIYLVYKLCRFKIKDTKEI